jgi:hypothetical protein
VVTACCDVASLDVNSDRAGRLVVDTRCNIAAISMNSDVSKLHAQKMWEQEVRFNAGYSSLKWVEKWVVQK